MVDTAAQRQSPATRRLELVLQDPCGATLTIVASTMIIATRSVSATDRASGAARSRRVAATLGGRSSPLDLHRSESLRHV
jgi:hypothetical protein